MEIPEYGGRICTSSFAHLNVVIVCVIKKMFL